MRHEVDSALPAAADASPRRSAGSQVLTRKSRNSEDNAELPGMQHKVVLIANYDGDRRESMERYVQLVYSGLKARGIPVSVWRPCILFGWIRRSPRGIGKWIGYLDKLVIYPLLLHRAVRKAVQSAHGRVLFHICDQSDAVYMPALRDFPHVVTCHDVTAIRAALGEIREHRPLFTGRLYQRLILNGLKKAGAVILVSSATRNDFRRLVGETTRYMCVIPNGMNYAYAPLPSSVAVSEVAELFERDSPPSQFLLSIGSNSWQKNRSGLIRIYAKAVELDARMPALVFAGERLSDELRDIVKAQGLAGRVYEVGKVTNRKLNALYSAAVGLFFPSLAEGFGWPIIEAQASRCRVLASALPALIEIGGESVYFIDPHDIAACGKRLVSFCHAGSARDHELLAGLENARRFSPDAMFISTLKTYEKVLERYPASHATHQTVSSEPCTGG